LKKTTKNSLSEIKDRLNFWPNIDLSEEKLPKFFFILTPPNSGSTVLAKILNTSPNSMILHSKAEGQWLLPSMFLKGRWNLDKQINWKKVKKVWIRKFIKTNAHVESLNLIIEKSPP